MKTIRRIDIDDHETKRGVVFYQLDSNRSIKLSTLRCIKLRKVLTSHDNGARIFNENPLELALDEIEYRKIIGIKIEKSLKI